MKDNFSEYTAYFAEYAENFIRRSHEPCLILKKEHTFRVTENSQKILESLNLNEEDRYCAKLTALYHDIGRFPQYEKYRTFLDSKSENHAFLGVRTLKQNPLFLKEPIQIQKKVLSAVILHNSLKLPKFDSESYKYLCNIIRDADKLDIVKVMAQNFTHNLPEKDSVILHVKDEPQKYTDAILRQALNRQTIKYTDLKYANDFKILLCGWVFALYFEKSRQLLKEQGDFFVILDSLPDTDGIRQFQNMIRKELAV